MLTRITFSLLIISTVALGAPISRVTDFVDGNVLTASQLNSEFNNVLSGVNSITNAQIASNAQISPAKFSATIKGTAIARDSGTGALSVKVDDSTIQNTGDNLALKDAGIITAKLADNSVTTAKIVDANITTAKILDANVTTAKIADAAVTAAKLAAVNAVYSSSSGAFSTTSTSLTDVTNLSVSITSTGRPIQIMMIGTSTSGTVGSGSGVRLTSNFDNSVAALYLVKSGTIVSNQTLTLGASGAGSSSTNMTWPCSSFNFIDFSAAGTYTYKVQVRNGVLPGTSLTTYVECNLVAYEL